MSRLVIALLQLALGRGVENDVSIAIGQAWVESRFDPKAVSRVVGNHRESGHWDGGFASNWRGPYFCGLWQVQANTEEDCIAMRDPLTSWFKRRDELHTWLRFCKGDVTCALDGYGCGVAGAREKRCNHYAERVLWRARDLYREIGS